MNKIYKLVWNASSGCWSVASEFARKGKPGYGVDRRALATGMLIIASGTATAENIKNNNVTACQDDSKSCLITPEIPELLIHSGSTITLNEDNAYVGNIALTDTQGTRGNLLDRKDNNTIKIKDATIENNGVVSGTFNDEINNKIYNKIKSEYNIPDTTSISFGGLNKLPLNQFGALSAVAGTDGSSAGVSRIINNGKVSLSSPLAYTGVASGRSVISTGVFSWSYSPEGESEVINNGEINVEGNNGILYFSGIRASADNIMVSNDGRITASGKLDTRGIVLTEGESGVIKNNGSVTVNSSEHHALGINSVHTRNVSVDLGDKSSVTVTAKGAGFGVSLSEKISLQNSGNITVSAGRAIGLSADGETGNIVDISNGKNASISVTGVDGSYNFLNPSIPNPFNRQYNDGDVGYSSGRLAP
ncbi:hypothetical protein JSU15_12115 [Escherichia coli O7:H4]|uniref:ESPR domain-containing protein n=1 Tax=Escherichia coli TaxID=562 RepID=UPI001AAE2357|nr:ESPR domain-containing protein [Escherichia coli]QTF19866.1 hypothetical protein JSU15_12115 [Escherichia coli O7:H4]